MFEQSKTAATVIKYKTEGGVEGAWTVADPSVTDEASARAFLAHHHPAYTFVSATREVVGKVVTK